MLKYKKPFTDKEINYYCYLQNKFEKGYLIYEDMMLQSIDADLPPGEELLEQRKRYNETSKKIDREIKIMKRKFGTIHTNDKFVIQLSEINDRYFLIDADNSIVEWDRDTYEYFKDKKGFRYVP
jgi:hypothetical protein